MQCALISSTLDPGSYAVLTRILDRYIFPAFQVRDPKSKVSYTTSAANSIIGVQESRKQKGVLHLEEDSSLL